MSAGTWWVNGVYLCAQVTLYVSFYVEAVNRDAFMAVKQDLLLAFIDCVDRNGAKLAKQRLEACPSLPVLPPLLLLLYNEFAFLWQRMRYLSVHVTRLDSRFMTCMVSQATWCHV